MLSKTLFAALLAATVCGAASVVPRYEYESDRAGKANAPAVCVQGQNDAQLCWDHDIRNHVFTGNPTLCDGMHVTSAAEQAFNAGTIRNLRVVSSSAITRMMSMEWTYGQGVGQQCRKTVWNNIQSYRLAPSLAHYTNESIHDIFVDTMDRTACVSTPDQQGIVVENRYASRICVSVGIGYLPTPGRTFFPRGIYTPAGNVGASC